MHKPQPKQTRYRNPKILKACHHPDNVCLVQLPGCQGSPTVPAHSNASDDGKGGSQKADDCFVAIACQHCHDILDGRKHYGGKTELDVLAKLWYHDRAIKRSIRRLIDLEVIK